MNRYIQVKELDQKIPVYLYSVEGQSSGSRPAQSSQPLRFSIATVSTPTSPAVSTPTSPAVSTPTSPAVPTSTPTLLLRMCITAQSADNSTTKCTDPGPKEHIAYDAASSSPKEAISCRLALAVPPIFAILVMVMMVSVVVVIWVSEVCAAGSLLWVLAWRVWLLLRRIVTGVLGIWRVLLLPGSHQSQLLPLLGPACRVR